MPFWKQCADRLKQINANTYETLEGVTVTSSLNANLAVFEKILGGNDDFNIHRFEAFGHFPAALVYFSDLSARNVINEEVLRALLHPPATLHPKDMKADKLHDVLLREVIYHAKSSAESQLKNVIESCCRGDTVLLVDGMEAAIVVITRFVEKRAIDQPKTEQVLRGAREGYIEPLGTNISLLRYRLQSPIFCVKTLTIGRVTKSKVAVCYLDGIAKPTLVDEVFKRLSAIDIDGVIDSGYLEQFIEDNHWSPFPQVANTERPDKTVVNLLEGRVAVLVDGSPIALMVPAVFNQFYQTLDDYTERFLMGSLVRFIRLVSLIFSLVFSSLYVSLISFNPELIPTKFAVAVAGGRAGVPYPAVIEVLILEISMEVLREATLRLPQQVGGALSIVGVLVIGQAAVSAGFASPITVVVIALTTIGSFATPAYNAAIALRMLRFVLIILAGLWGLYGVMAGFLLISNHVLSLRSFGVRYLTPIVPGDWEGVKDTLVRAPLWLMPKRPRFLDPSNEVRISSTTQETSKRPRGNIFGSLNVGKKRRS